MHNLISVRIAQVKSLFGQCVESGLSPSFSLTEFEAGVEELETLGSSESDINRFVLFHHQLLHEMLFRILLVKVNEE